MSMSCSVVTKLGELTSNKLDNKHTALLSSLLIRFYRLLPCNISFYMPLRHVCCIITGYPRLRLMSVANSLFRPSRSRPLAGLRVVERIDCMASHTTHVDLETISLLWVSRACLRPPFNHHWSPSVTSLPFSLETHPPECDTYV
jgi:hypothetical protein